MVVLGAAALIMVSASVYVEATHLGFQRQALTHHRSQAREGAFAGVQWARLNYGLTGDDHGQDRLELAGPVEVTISYQAGPEALEVTVTARARGAVETLRARLEPRGDDELYLAEFAFER